jgi:hypothetical protein
MLLSGTIHCFSQINTKHINTVWQNVKFLNTKRVGASRDQKALKV